MGHPGRLDRLALAAMLALAMQACLLCAACQQADDDPVVVGVSESGAPVIAGEGMATAKAGSHPVTQAEIDELWNALSEEDRELLTRNLNGKREWDRYSEYSDPEGAWEKLDEKMRKQITKQNGLTREQWILQRRTQGQLFDKAYVADAMQQALNRNKPLVAGEANVDRGDAVEWQVVEEHEKQQSGPGYRRYVVFPGNFDDDPEEEVAIQYRGIEFRNQDGSILQTPGLDLVALLEAFDYDGDGVDELLDYDPANAKEGGRLYTGDSGVLRGLDGEILAHTPGTAWSMRLPELDMDGDGLPELLCYKLNQTADRNNTAFLMEKTLYAIEQAGGEIFNTQCSNMDDIMVGDVDGDGRDELLIKRPSETKTNAFDQLFVGIDQEDQDVLSASGQRDVDPILALVDINGDGRVDLVSSGHVYLSWNSDTVELEFPEGYMLPTAHRQPRPQVVLWQRDGERLLAALLVQDYDDNRSDTLGLWDSSGKLVYMEHFGEQVNDILTGEDGRRLYVVTDTRLLAGV
ncbi:MAG: hypothetical protein H7A35_00175 [Planctomycetales bacterium]|nr:hypothetical protein [bacterium]UNM08478.1 MAG: hypothetical protein H7A35_00175 [Planctomycetales bacterium]